MNVVDNLNSVKVINKPCVCSRTMRLSTFCRLRRDKEQGLLLSWSSVSVPVAIPNKDIQSRFCESTLLVDLKQFIR
jgi:hypothetical protein